jgi:hypothetical protein
MLPIGIRRSKPTPHPLAPAPAFRFLDPWKGLTGVAEAMMTFPPAAKAMPAKAVLRGPHGPSTSPAAQVSAFDTRTAHDDSAIKGW